jgi:hypothetical protein
MESIIDLQMSSLHFYGIIYFLNLIVCPPTIMLQRLTQKFRLNYENIHACPKGCLFFRGDHIDDVSCPKCGSPCYKDVVNKVLFMKVFQHFPIIPRLQRLFKTPIVLKLMFWHSQNSSLDGLVKHPCD